MEAREGVGDVGMEGREQRGEVGGCWGYGRVGLGDGRTRGMVEQVEKRAGMPGMGRGTEETVRIGRLEGFGSGG